MYENNKRLLLKVTRMTKGKHSWENETRVRYGGPQMAIQTYVYAGFEPAGKREVKVEAYEPNDNGDLIYLGVVDMAAYMKRNSLETFAKRP